MSSTDVQTTIERDANLPIAMRTPLYPIISCFGVLIILATFMTWVESSNPDDAAVRETVSGVDAGGWGLSAIIVGGVIVALGVLGYLWNPFSDPEAVLIAGFSLAAMIGALVKMSSPESLFVDSEPIVDYFEPTASAGLWVILLSGFVSLVASMWILVSRPDAQAALDHARLPTD